MNKHNNNRIIVILFILVGIIGFASQVLGYPDCPECGSTITSSCTLQSDRTCEENDYCWTVGANNITIDGNHHTITYDGGDYCYKGIYVSGYNNITIENFGTSDDLGISGFWDAGIYLENSSGDTVQNNIVKSNSQCDIYIEGGSGNHLNYNTVESSYQGIYLNSSSSNDLIGNIANSNAYGIPIDGGSGNHLNYNTTSLNNDSGIYLNSSSSNILTGNVVDSNLGYGIYLHSSPLSVLSNNTMSGNSPNLFIDGTSDAQYSNTIDTSNTVEGKPVYYLYNIDGTANSPFVYDGNNIGDIGMFWCISCDYVKVKNATLSPNNYYGIYFNNTTNSTVKNITASSNTSSGIYLEDSYSDTLADNTTELNQYGIYLDSSGSSDSPIILNDNHTHSNTLYGMYFYDSYSNIFSGSSPLNPTPPSTSSPVRSARYHLWNYCSQGFMMPIHDSPSIAPIGTGNVSLSFWYSCSKHPSPYFQLTICHDLGCPVSCTRAISLYFNNQQTSPHYPLRMHYHAVMEDHLAKSEADFLIIDNDPYDANPHLLVMTVDRSSSDGLKLYYDGILKDTADPTYFENMDFSACDIADTPNVAGGVYFNVGDGYKEGSGYPFLDEIRVYTGVALSSDQVSDMYNGGCGRDVDEDEFKSIATAGCYMEFDDQNTVSPLVRVLSDNVWSDTTGRTYLPEDLVPAERPLPLCNRPMITSSAGSGGTISPTGINYQTWNKATAFEATANQGFRVNNWYVDGSIVQTGGDCYVLPGTDTDRTVMVDFYTKPSAPTVEAASTTSLNVTINENNNPSSVTFSIKVGSKYVQADGTLGDSAVYQTKTAWGTPVTITGLLPNTQYTVSVDAKNGAGVATDYSDASSKYTLAPASSNLIADTIGYASITLLVDSFPNAASGSSGYYFSRQGGGNSGWIQTNTWQDTGLTCGTSYTYSVKYQNGDGVPTGSISLNTATTACDSDADGLPDWWELENFGNLDQGPNDDPDNDGWTNLEEYLMGYDPNRATPLKPVGSPLGDDVSLTPTFSASDYSDSELDPHLFTEWQISSGIDFADTELVFDDISTINKQTIQIPLAVLKPETTYYWRVRYSDLGGWSHWSVHIEFTTESLKNFLADNEGIDTTDVITSDTGIIQAYRQNPDNFTNLPSGYLFYNDIFSFRIEDITPGATVAVTFQLDEIFQPYHKWLKYYPNLGTWDDTYTAHIVSGIGNTQVTLEFKDGDFGDIDGLKNGVIVDPNGPAILTGERGGGEKDYCFIATATYGTPMAFEVRVLSRFRNEYLLTNTIGKGFVKTYYKISPPVADFIREHPVLKKAVRSALNPIIWVSRELIE